MTPGRSVSRGRCVECERVFTLTMTGVVRNHFAPTGHHQRCEGSGVVAKLDSVTTRTLPSQPHAWWWGVTTDQFIEPHHRNETDAYRRAQQLQALTPRTETVRIYTFELGSWTLHDTLAGRK